MKFEEAFASDEFLPDETAFARRVWNREARERNKEKEGKGSTDVIDDADQAGAAMWYVLHELKNYMIKSGQNKIDRAEDDLHVSWLTPAQIRKEKQKERTSGCLPSLSDLEL